MKILDFFSRLIITVGMFILTVGCIHQPYMPAGNSNTITIKAPIIFEGDKPQQEWERIEATLMHSSAKVIILEWQGVGGRVDTMWDFVRAVKMARQLGKEVIFIIQGPAISAHAIAMCYGSSYKMQSTGSLIYHAPFGRDFNGNKTYSDVNSWNNSTLDECNRIGILSQQELLIIKQEHKRIEIYPNGQHIIKDDWK